jgi:hypothetical protein
MRHPRKVSATQRQALERLYDRSWLSLSNRNGEHIIAAATARKLRDLGLVRLHWQRFREQASITDAGRRRVQEWRRSDLQAAVKASGVTLEEAAANLQRAARRG